MMIIKRSMRREISSCFSRCCTTSVLNPIKVEEVKTRVWVDFNTAPIPTPCFSSYLTDRLIASERSGKIISIFLCGHRSIINSIPDEDGLQRLCTDSWHPDDSYKSILLSMVSFAKRDNSMYYMLFSENKNFKRLLEELSYRNLEILITPSMESILGL